MTRMCSINTNYNRTQGWYYYGPFVQAAVPNKETSEWTTLLVAEPDNTAEESSRSRWVTFGTLASQQ